MYSYTLHDLIQLAHFLGLKSTNSNRKWNRMNEQRKHDQWMVQNRNRVTLFCLKCFNLATQANNRQLACSKLEKHWNVIKPTAYLQSVLRSFFISIFVPWIFCLCFHLVVIDFIWWRLQNAMRTFPSQRSIFVYFRHNYFDNVVETWN